MFADPPVRSLITNMILNATTDKSCFTTVADVRRNTYEEGKELRQEHESYGINNVSPNVGLNHSATGMNPLLT